MRIQTLCNQDGLNSHEFSYQNASAHACAGTAIVGGATGKFYDRKIKNPSSSVLAILKKERADITVVLAYMNEPGLRSLAESLPEVDYIVGGPTGQLLAPSSVGPVEIMSATNKGKFLARIEVRKTDKGWKAAKRARLKL